jgi:hypothetical protein
MLGLRPLGIDRLALDVDVIDQPLEIGREAPTIPR